MSQACHSYFKHAAYWTKIISSPRKTHYGGWQVASIWGRAEWAWVGCSLETNIVHSFEYSAPFSLTKTRENTCNLLNKNPNCVSISAAVHRKALSSSLYFLIYLFFEGWERDSLFVPLSSTLMCQNSCCSWSLNGRDDAPNVRKTDTEDRIIPPETETDTQTTKKKEKN